MRPIVYDLTDLLHMTSGQTAYYGVARVVVEIGAGLLREGADVRFAVYSPGHRAFYEITPKQTGPRATSADLPVPHLKRRLKTKHYPDDASPTEQMLNRLDYAIKRHRNRKRWREAHIELPEISLEGTVFFSACQPRFSARAVRTIRRNGWDTKIAFLLHDMFTLHPVDDRFGDTFSEAYLRDSRDIITLSDMIVTNSQFTADDILQFADKGTLPQPKAIGVACLAHESVVTNEFSEHPLPDVPYFLCVGTELGRKNLESVLEALRMIGEDGHDIPRLVLAGCNGGHVKMIQGLLAKPKFAKVRMAVRYVKSPNQTDLNRLYQHALALLIPSRMEGWGLPLGEALVNGCPVISSTAPALKECGGDLAVYFDPEDHATLAAHIRQFQTEPEVVERHRAEIRARRDELRNWQDVARDVKRLCEQAGA